MLISELSGYPDDYVGIVAGCVGEQLAEVVVISAFQLIFYDDRAIASHVMSKYI